jgi:hypothetical protein
MTRRRFVNGVVLAPVLRAWGQSTELTIGCAVPDTLGAFGRGVRLGLHEAARAAMLLGHQLRVVPPGSAATAYIAPVAAAGARTPLVAMSSAGATAPCTFLTAHTAAERSAAAARARASAPSAAPMIAEWHPAFRRYGASELNERFVAMFKMSMDDQAWHGWVAVKAIVEAFVRAEGGDLCRAIATLRFDGHKGRALRFDPLTRRLQHPLLVVRRTDGVVSVETVK